MDRAFNFVANNGGICTEEDYWYLGMDESCQKRSCDVVEGTAPTSHTDVKIDSVASLMSAVAQQPVSVALEADQPGWQHYASGVMSSACGDYLDHGVLLVGYGTDADTGEDFWKVKNSWGAFWGEDGYIRLSRGEVDESTGGQCGILEEASYPVLA